ncbi:MAG: hypothetical protein ACREBC_27020, partial [Pyrinomonadaceae bacterium]
MTVKHSFVSAKADGADATLVNPSSWNAEHALDIAHCPAGRVTLESGVAVSTTDQTAKTSVLYTPYVGQFVPIYSGAVWTPTVFTELTLALDSDSGHTGYHQSGKNFDLFVVNDAGTVRLGTGPAWTSDTARGTGAGTTELERKNGIWTNKVSMTLRFGSVSGNMITVVANQGTYVATVRASANGQTQIKFGSLAANGGEAWLGIWNAYNRVLVAGSVRDNSNTWTYATASYRNLNNSVSNRISFVRGLNEDAMFAQYAGNTTSSGAVFGGFKVAVDGTSDNGSFETNATSGAYTNIGGNTYAGHPGLGFHYLTAMEYASGATVTFGGDSGGSTNQSGLQYV